MDDLPSTVTVRVNGDLDYASAPAILERALAALTSPELAALVIDLEGVPFADSSGVGMLVDIHQHASRMKVTVRFVSTPPQLRRVIQMSGLESLFGMELDGPATLD